MSDQLQNKVALTSALIQSQPTAKALLELPAVKENWGQVYAKVTGRPEKEGLVRYEAEKLLLLQQCLNNPALAKCDNFSIYVAITELAITGGTLRNGLCYIVPFKGKAVYMPGWKFRLEQINLNPKVVHCHEPVVVYDCDEFDYELGMSPRIITHKPGKNRTADNKPIYVYWVIEFKKGPQVYIMDACKIYQIRDQYSKSYQEYNKKKASGQWEAWMELPMWIKDESQAFQKTIVKQVWKSLPKEEKTWQMLRMDDMERVTGIEDREPEDMQAPPDLSELVISNGDATGETGPAPQATGQAPAAVTDLEFEETGTGKVGVDTEVPF